MLHYIRHDTSCWIGAYLMQEAIALVKKATAQVGAPRSQRSAVTRQSNRRLVAFAVRSEYALTNARSSAKKSA
jgi:hypothetical protein